MKMFSYNLVVFLIILLAIALYFTREVRNEGFFVSPGTLDQLASTEAFGMSPGTLDQLQSTRVISKKEQDINDTIYNNLTRQGIINMTESGYNNTDYSSTGAIY
jgi:hypothetical protein